MYNDNLVGILNRNDSQSIESIQSHQVNYFFQNTYNSEP